MATEFHKDDKEIIDFILFMFFLDGKYQQLDFYSVGTILQDNKVHDWDAERIWRKLQSEEWITIGRITDNVTYYKLSDKGMGLLRVHGSYSNFVRYLKNKEARKEKIEKDDRKVKNIGILATLIISLLTLVLTLLTKQKDQPQKKTEEGLQLIEKKLDSVLQSSKQLPTETGKQPVKDTATNK